MRTTVLLSLFATLAGCQQEPTYGSTTGAKMDEASSPAESSSGRLEIYMQRFRKARNDPRLVRGSLITSATVNCKAPIQVRDTRNGHALTLGAGESNGGYFTLLAPNSYTLGQVERFRSVDGYKRIFVISDISARLGTKLTNIRTLDREQINYIADLIETLQNNCVGGRTRHIASFVLFDESEVPRG